jgi:hypothetical protein
MMLFIEFLVRPLDNDPIGQNIAQGEERNRQLALKKPASSEIKN